MHSFTPARHAPALLSPRPALLEIGELPEMVYHVEIADLHEPRANAYEVLASVT